MTEQWRDDKLTNGGHFKGGNGALKLVAQLFLPGRPFSWQSQ